MSKQAEQGDGDETDGGFPADGCESTRKLSIVGRSTFTVSLPKPWVRRMGLSAGQEVLLRTNPDGSILLLPHRRRVQTRRGTFKANPGMAAEEVLRRIVAYYTAGADRIDIRLQGTAVQPVRAAALQACDRLLGLQLVEEDASHVGLQNLSAAFDLDVRKAIRMMHHNARRMLLHYAWLLDRRGARLAAEDMVRCEEELDRLLLFLLRQHNLLLRDAGFSESAGLRAEESHGYLLTALYLERIGDYCAHAMEIRNRAPTVAGTPPAERLAEPAHLALQMLDDAVTAFLGHDIGLADTVIDRLPALIELVQRQPLEVVESRERLEILPTCTMCLEYVHTHQGIERIGRYAKSIAENAFNQAHLDAMKP